MKRILEVIFLFFLSSYLFSQTNYLEELKREISEEERFLESIIQELISKGNRDFIETLIYRMGYERAQDKLPKLFFPLQFGGGEMVSSGVGVHIYNRQFYTYLSGGYTVYGKYKDYSVSFINEVKMFDIYFYKRDRIDVLIGAKISYFSEPGTFISSIEVKQIVYFYELFFNPYLVVNLFFDRDKGKSTLKYQIGLGVNFYPWD